jgi:hypothetical protein
MEDNYYNPPMKFFTEQKQGRKQFMKHNTQHLLLLTIFVCLGNVVFAQESNDAYNRAGRWGIGLSSIGGIGGRYWFTNKVGVDAGALFSYSNGAVHSISRNYGATAQMVYLLAQKGGLRLEGLTGVIYRYTSIDTNSDSSTFFGSPSITAHSVSTGNSITKETDAGVGLGVEYSFQELPDLSFGAFATGLGATFTTTDSSSQSTTTFSDGSAPNSFSSPSHSYTRSFATNPLVGLTIRYYF